MLEKNENKYRWCTSLFIAGEHRPPLEQAPIAGAPA
jgi:hypothetical protein